MDDSYFCIGSDPSDPEASGNICLIIPFHDGGFIDVSSLPEGQYFFYLRIGSNHVYLSAIRAF